MTDLPTAPPRAHATASSFTAPDLGLFVALALTWGLSFVFIKTAVAEVSPLWIVAVRTIVGATVLLVILRLRGRTLPRDPRVWGHLVVLAIIGNTVPWAGVAWAQQFIPSGLTSVVNSLVPASTLAIAAGIGLERLTRHRIIGLVLAMTGTVIVVAGELGAPGGAAAILVVVIATTLYGASAVYTKRFVSDRHPPLVLATGQVLAAAVMILPVAWIVGPTPAWSTLSGGVVGSLAALGALGTGMAFLLFYVLIARVGATNATMVTYVTPVIGLVAGWLLLDERFGGNVIIGAAVIIVGIWLAQRQVAPAHADAAVSDRVSGVDQPVVMTRNRSA